MLKNWSIVYVDSGSSDESIGVARYYTKDIYLVNGISFCGCRTYGRVAGIECSFNGYMARNSVETSSFSISGARIHVL